MTTPSGRAAAVGPGGLPSADVGLGGQRPGVRAAAARARPAGAQGAAAAAHAED